MGCGEGGSGPNSACFFRSPSKNQEYGRDVAAAFEGGVLPGTKIDLTSIGKRDENPYVRSLHRAFTYGTLSRVVGRKGSPCYTLPCLDMCLKRASVAGARVCLELAVRECSRIVGIKRCVCREILKKNDSS